jgi:hypothetical protein
MFVTLLSIIVLERLGEKIKFLWEGFLVTEGSGSVYQGCIPKTHTH